MSAHWGQAAWVSTSLQPVPHHRELLPSLGHRKKGGSKSLLAAPAKRLPLRVSREGQSPPQEDWGVLELWVVEREGKVLLPKEPPGRDMEPTMPWPGVEDNLSQHHHQHHLNLCGNMPALFYFTLFLAFPAPYKEILAPTAPKSACFAKAVRVKCTNNMTLTSFTFVIFKGWRQGKRCRRQSEIVITSINECPEAPSKKHPFQTNICQQ